MDGGIVKAMQAICMQQPVVIGNTIIPNNEPVLLVKSWNAMKAALISLFQRVIEIFKTVAWRTIVMAGKIPAYVDLLISALKRIPTATSSTLLKLNRIVFNNLGPFWEYVTTLFGGKLDADLEQSRNETMSFKWIIQSAASVFRDVTYELSKAFVSLVTAVADMLYAAMNNMSGALFSIMDIGSTTIAAVKRKTTEYCMFYFMVMGDARAIANQREVYIDARMGTMARHFATFTEGIVPDLKFTSDIDLTQSSIFDLFNLKDAFKIGENVVEWFLEHMWWLVDVLRTVVSASIEWVKNSIFMAPLMSSILEPHIEAMAKAMEGIQQNHNVVLQQHEALIRLAQNNTMSPLDRRNLTEVITASSTVLKFFADKDAAQKNAKWGMKDGDVIKEKVDGARIIMELLTSDPMVPVSEATAKRMDELITYACAGVTINDTNVILGQLEELQAIQLLKTFDEIQNDSFTRIAGKTGKDKEDMNDEDFVKERIEQTKKRLETIKQREQLKLLEEEERKRDLQVEYGHLDINELVSTTRGLLNDYEAKLQTLAAFDELSAYERTDETLQLDQSRADQLHEVIEERRINVLSVKEKKFETEASILNAKKWLSQLIINSDHYRNMTEKQRKRLEYLADVIYAKEQFDLAQDILSKRRENSPYNYPKIGVVYYNTKNWKLYGAAILAIALGGGICLFTAMTLFPPKKAPETKPLYDVPAQEKPNATPIFVDPTPPLVGFEDISWIFGKVAGALMPLTPFSIFSGQLWAELQSGFGGGITSGFHLNRVVNLLMRLGGLGRGMAAIVGCVYYLSCSVWFALIDIRDGRSIGDTIGHYAHMNKKRVLWTFVFAANGLFQTFESTEDANAETAKGLWSMAQGGLGFGASLVTSGFAGVAMSTVTRLWELNKFKRPLLPNFSDLELLNWVSVLPIADKSELISDFKTSLREDLKRTERNLLTIRVSEAANNAKDLIALQNVNTNQIRQLTYDSTVAPPTDFKKYEVLEDSEPEPETEPGRARMDDAD